MKPEHVLGATAGACCLIIAASVWVFVSVATGLVHDYSPRAGMSGAAVQDIVFP